MNHFRFLVLRSVVLLFLSACAVCAERARATDYDSYLYDIALALGLQSHWDYPLADNIHDTAAVIMYENRDALYYWTNRITRLPGDSGRGSTQYGVRADIQAITRITNVFHTSSQKLWVETPEGTYGFLPWYDELIPVEQYYTQDFPEFLALTLGQYVDSRGFNDYWHTDTNGMNRYAESMDEAWDIAFNPWKSGAQYMGDMSFYSVWEAHAWRKLLDAITASSDAWNTPEGSNVWNDVLADSTNGVPRVPISSTNLWDNSLSFVSNSVPTNSIAWGQYGTTNASPDMPQPLVRDLGWVWTPPESGAYEVKLFGFERLDGNLTGSLAIDFTDSSWGVVNKVAKFFWALGTALFMFALLRNEWNFWTTLGGSAT